MHLYKETKAWYFNNMRKRGLFVDKKIMSCVYIEIK